jgi:hypothetical protein
MDTNTGVKSRASLEKSESETFSGFPTGPYVITRERTAEPEGSDLQNASNAIQMADERSRQQRCQCEWDYATGHGTQRAHNPLCPVHDPVLDPVATERGLARK